MPNQTAVAKLLRDRATPGELEILDAAIAEAEKRGVPIYAVGGAVRDLLGGEPAADLDLVIEGDAVEFAQGIATHLGASLEPHRQFGTATLSMGDINVDFASARQEHYPNPASLPTVRPGTLEQDLARRDFSVNAMAVSLWPGREPDLIDPFSGVSDLESQTLEVLHDHSFIDDPTRILRAIRLESRSELRLSDRALELARDAIRHRVFDALSGDRLRREVELLFTTPDKSVAILARLDELHLLQVLVPHSKITSVEMDWLKRLVLALTELDSIQYEPEQLTWWLVVVSVLTSTLDDSKRAAVAERLALQGEAASLLRDGNSRLFELESELGTAELPPHRVDEVLDRSTPVEILFLLASKKATVRDWVARWFRELRPVELDITGKDLLTEGFEPGPWIGRALTATRNARLDGNLRSGAELEFALDYLARSQDTT